MSSAIAIVLKGYPRLSETFIAQELHGLERRGVHLRLYSLRRPTDPAVHPIHREIRAPVTYLPEYLHDAPRRVFRAWWALHRTAGYRAARRAFLRDLRREPTRNRLRRFGQALVLAHELANDVGWLHAHFLHTPGSVARYAAMLRRLPWSVSAHAKDVWTIPDWEKREKLADCRWLVTCSRVNANHLSALAADPAKVSLLYHGLDLARFPRGQRRPARRDGSDDRDPVIILSVGRAVTKKGYDVLLESLGRLPADLAWRFVHVGAGPSLPRLQRLASRLAIAHRIDWLGARPQQDVLDQYRRADLFVLACRIAADGDRDGLPNVLMEAQSQGVACVSTTVSAVPELIIDGETGVLVPPDDPQALASALLGLIRTPSLRDRLGAAGAVRVRTAFAAGPALDLLAARLGAVSRSASPCTLLSTPR